MGRRDDACEIARLPCHLLEVAISLAATGTRDACRLATVSPAFRAAADSDNIWSRFLPSDLGPLAAPSAAPRSKKELFLRLSGSYALFADGLMSAWLGRESCGKCYMVAARAMYIIWGDAPQYWRWIPHDDSRFSECAELLDVCWLDIGCSIASRMLSDNTIYAAYLVFKMADDVYGLDSPLQEAWIYVGGTSSSRPVRLQSDVNNEEDVVIGGDEEAPQVVQVPRGRADGWMELEIGEFYTEQGDDGEVRARLKETNGGNWKRGLIVQGIEFRPKN